MAVAGADAAVDDREVERAVVVEVGEDGAEPGAAPLRAGQAGRRGAVAELARGALLARGCASPR